MGHPSGSRYRRFGVFQLDLRTRELRRNGVKVRSAILSDIMQGDAGLAHPLPFWLCLAVTMIGSDASTKAKAQLKSMGVDQI